MNWPATHPKLGPPYCYNMLRSGKQSQLIVGTGCQLTAWVNHCGKKLFNHNLNLRTFFGRQFCCSLSLVDTFCPNASMYASILSSNLQNQDRQDRYSKASRAAQIWGPRSRAAQIRGNISCCMLARPCSPRDKDPTLIMLVCGGD